MSQEEYKSLKIKYEALNISYTELLRTSKDKENELSKVVNKLNLEVNSLKEELKIQKNLIEKISKSDYSSENANEKKEMDSLMKKVEVLENKNIEKDKVIFNLKIDLSNKNLEIDRLRIVGGGNSNEHEISPLINSNEDNTTKHSSLSNIKKKPTKSQEYKPNLIDVSMLNEDETFREFADEAKRIIVDLMNDSENLRVE
jgi:hypothetical protein